MAEAKTKAVNVNELEKRVAKLEKALRAITSAAQRRTLKL